MISIHTRYFNLNRILLLIIGLWPYQQSKLVRFQMILLFSILSSFIIFQLTIFATAEFSTNLAINVLSCALCFTIFAICYGAFLINAQTIKGLLEQIQHTYNELRDENEFAIMEEYGCSAKNFTTKMTVLVAFVTVVFFFEPCWPRILGIFLSVNQSGHSKHILTEYFMDEEKYFYLIILHMDAALCIGLITMLATGTMFIAYIKHACGMFRIASYRMERAMTVGILENIKLENNVTIYKNIMCVVDIHRKAMTLSGSLSSKFQGTFFLLVTITVASLSLNLYGITALKDDIKEHLPHLIRIPVILLFMFLGNYLGQDVIDHNEHVFFTAYNVQWYNAPLYAQKLILFLLQRGNKAFALTLGGVLIASLECLATLMSASISYFTVIYSTQK